MFGKANGRKNFSRRFSVRYFRVLAIAATQIAPAEENSAAAARAADRGFFVAVQHDFRNAHFGALPAHARARYAIGVAFPRAQCAVGFVRVCNHSDCSIVVFSGNVKSLRLHCENPVWENKRA